MQKYILIIPTDNIIPLSLQLLYGRPLGQAQVNYIMSNIPRATQCYTEYIQ